MKKSLYDLLGVSPTASKKEVKSQFYRLSLLYHPDRLTHGKSETTPTAAASNLMEENRERYIKINNAYQILSNDQERRRYDLEHGFSGIKRADSSASKRNIWNPHPGARHSRHPGAATGFDEMRRDEWGRRAPDITDHTLERWSRWAKEGRAGREQLERAREVSFQEIQEQSRNAIGRFLIIVSFFTLYFFMENS